VVLIIDNYYLKLRIVLDEDYFEVFSEVLRFVFSADDYGDRRTAVRLILWLPAVGEPAED
jgi:hypothetical protein